MCSLTWLATEDGYELFFNRDESRERLPARPPGLELRDGLEILAPTDADAGGTWLGINAYGLTVGLLNGKGLAPAPKAPLSRGLLVRGLLDATDTYEVERRLRAMDLTDRRAFRLVALEPGADLSSAEWDGRELRCERLGAEGLPLSSSSLDPDGALENRQRVLGGLREDSGDLSEHLLDAFHHSHDPKPSAVSACMHRPDAETVSFTRTRVSATEVELGYSPAPPCRRVPLSWIGVSRRQPMAVPTRNAGGA